MLAQHGCQRRALPLIQPEARERHGAGRGHCWTRGVNIGLGTDGAASNNRLDLFDEMRLAALLAKGSSRRCQQRCRPAQALRNGARWAPRARWGWKIEIGSLEAGKFADIAAMRSREIETSPCYDPHLASRICMPGAST